MIWVLTLLFLCLVAAFAFPIDHERSHTADQLALSDIPSQTLVVDCPPFTLPYHFAVDNTHLTLTSLLGKGTFACTYAVTGIEGVPTAAAKTSISGYSLPPSEAANLHQIDEFYLNGLDDQTPQREWLIMDYWPGVVFDPYKGHWPTTKDACLALTAKLRPLVVAAFQTYGVAYGIVPADIDPTNFLFEVSASDEWTPTICHPIDWAVAKELELHSDWNTEATRLGNLAAQDMFGDVWCSTLSQVEAKFRRPWW